MTLINACFSEHGWILGVAVGCETHDPEWGAFNIDVPEHVWNAYIEAVQTLDAVRERVLAATGLARHAPMRMVPCGSFRQDKPDPQKFMGEVLTRRCQTCGHYAKAHTVLAVA